jgi:hypothetical protein
MTFVIDQSIALSTETRESWRHAGGIFAARHRNPNEVMELAFERNADFILNLGVSTHSWDDPEIPVWNQGHDISGLIYPDTTRQMFGDLLPPKPDETTISFWLKGPGSSGQNKTKREVTLELPVPTPLPNGWDTQLHIDGVEFRAITVNNKIVQGMARYGGNEERQYAWVGVAGLPQEVKDVVHTAARAMAGNNVLAWDTILDNQNKAWLLEGNSCPGVNLYTAMRVIEQVRAIQEGRDNA